MRLLSGQFSCWLPTIKGSPLREFPRSADNGWRTSKYIYVNPVHRHEDDAADLVLSQELPAVIVDVIPYVVERDVHPTLRMTRACRFPHASSRKSPITAQVCHEHREKHDEYEKRSQSEAKARHLNCSTHLRSANGSECPTPMSLSSNIVEPCRHSISERRSREIAGVSGMDARSLRAIIVGGVARCDNPVAFIPMVSQGRRA